MGSILFDACLFGIIFGQNNNLMIQANQISKKFNDLEALSTTSFTIEKGEVFGLLGPNGAGKSTTLNLICGLLQPDSGEILVNGNSVTQGNSSYKKCIGTVPQEIALYEEFSGYDNLMFWGRLYGISKLELKSKIDDALKMIGLYDRRKELVKNYSGGMKRRINIAASILHDPLVLLLDEPTVGVDPQSRNKIFELIEELNQQGITIIYTSHYMEEVERLCNRIAIMDKGKIIAQGTQKELGEHSKVKESVSIAFDSLSESEFKQLMEKSNTKASKKSNVIELEDSSPKTITKVIQAISDLNLTMNNLEIEKVNLEKIFLDLTGKSLRD